MKKCVVLKLLFTLNSTKPYKVETEFISQLVNFKNNGLESSILSENFPPWRLPEQCAVFQALSGVPPLRLQGSFGGLRGEVSTPRTRWKQTDPTPYGGDRGRILQDHHYDVDSFVLQRTRTKWRRSIASCSFSHIAVFCVHPLCLQPLRTPRPSLPLCIEKLHLPRTNNNRFSLLWYCFVDHVDSQEITKSFGVFFGLFSVITFIATKKWDL